MRWWLSLMAVALLWRTAEGSSTVTPTPGDCLLENDVVTQLKEVACNATLRFDDCAREYRKIVQNRYSGAWGAIVIGDLEMIISETIEWHITEVGEKPNRCRLLVQKGLLLEIFRTGYRSKDIENEQRQWIQEQAQSLGVQSDNFDVCPHSMLRTVINDHPLLHSELKVRRRRSHHHHHLHAAVSRMASVFAAESSHHWNVFVTKKTEGKVPSIGFNLPHYVNDGRAGFCIGQTPDGFIVNAVIIGFDSEKSEILSKG